MRLAERLRFTVDTHHLLPRRVRHSRQNTRLGRRRVAFETIHSTQRHLLRPQSLKQQAPRLIIADDAHRKHIHFEIGQVHDRVCAAARHNGALAVLQNEHWGLARNPRNLAINKLVGYQVGEHRYGNVRE